jgi:hypothetical protein
MTKNGRKTASKKKDKTDTAGLLGALFGLGGDDDDWEKTWNARQKGLEALLGKSGNQVLHAPIPLALGGSADVLIFPKFPGGIAYVTADLTLSNSGQKPNSLGNYELMICARREEAELASAISRLAAETLKHKFEVGDVLDLTTQSDTSVEAILFCEGEPKPRFKAAGQECGLLLCLAISKEEARTAKTEGWQKVTEARKRGGTFPFSEPRRKRFHEQPFWNDMPAELAKGALKGATPDFVAEVNQSLGDLRKRLEEQDHNWGLASFAKWEFSQETGALVFTLLDGSRAVCAGQIIGSRSSKDSSWEWAWNNPHLEKRVTKAAAKLKAHGKANGISQLTTGMLPKVSKDAAWSLAAFAARNQGFQGVYCGNAGVIDVYIAFQPPRA